MSIVARRSAFPSPVHPVASAFSAVRVASPWRTLLTRIKAMVGALKNRRAVMTLLDMDDRMLRDIGLVRTDVTSALASPPLTDPSFRLAEFAGERRAAARVSIRERVPGCGLVIPLPPRRRTGPARFSAVDMSNTA